MAIIRTKTKILATLGPASDSAELILKLVDAGANGFRLNFSHGDKNYFNHLFEIINNVCEARKLPIPIIQDLQGPKIRIGKLKKDKIEIFSGNKIEITIDKLEGDENIISSSYLPLVNDAQIGETILIDDGLIKLEVAEKKERSLICNIIDGGILKPNKGMNLPGMKLSTPALTDQDKANLEFALQYRIDYIALSFVRSANDIIELRNWLQERGYDKPIIAKIEKPEAVENFEEILEVADVIMVARGDLGVELKPQLVPTIQKRIIRRCNEVGKLVITATQMLESMISNPIPTRAEASDVANAVLDGTDVVMLSGETAAGAYPIKSVKMMYEIILSNQAQRQFLPKVNWEVPVNKIENIFDATAKAFVQISDQIQADAMVVFTHQGRQAMRMSKYNPNADIYAFSDSFDVLNSLNLHKGITPLYLQDINDENYYMTRSVEILKEKGFIQSGDLLLFAAGAPLAEVERKSWVRFKVV
ncbi:MAG: pyruvate kinase [Bacteroidetes bacterium]|nr:pyruvate kinase [Bacteroidota bacterium]MBU1113905.1 pyruvate kinase [Bacteroidota bacterium]MBU1798224.1 pyruvate kinase [Bacteroidota bacterium]